MELKLGRVQPFEHEAVAREPPRRPAMDNGKRARRRAESVAGCTLANGRADQMLKGARRSQTEAGRDAVMK